MSKIELNIELVQSFLVAELTQQKIADLVCVSRQYVSEICRKHQLRNYGNGRRVRAKHGFAGMSKVERTEIARKGGKSVQKQGKGHRYTSEEAQKAGKVGGRGNKKQR